MQILNVNYHSDVRKWFVEYINEWRNNCQISEDYDAREDAVTAGRNLAQCMGLCCISKDGMIQEGLHEYQLAIESPDGNEVAWIGRGRLLRLLSYLWDLQDAKEGHAQVRRWQDNKRNTFFVVQTTATLEEIRAAVKAILGAGGPVWDLTDITFE